MRESSTRRSGVRVRYLDNAPDAPAGLPILFSPGFSDVAEEYAAMLAFFHPRRVLVVEVRGRGGSEVPATGYAAADHAADLRAVLDEEEIGRCHVMTFSRGTTWGLDLVLADPARVASVSIGDYWAREFGLDHAAADRILTTRFRGRPLVDRIARHVPHEVFGASRHRDLLGDLAATGLPVLVATGTAASCLLDAAALDEYRQRLPGVEIVVVEGAGHDLFRPDPLAYPAAVSSFIARRAPGT